MAKSGLTNFRCAARAAFWQSSSLRGLQVCIITRASRGSECARLLALGVLAPSCPAERRFGVIGYQAPPGVALLSLHGEAATHPTSSWLLG